jgi:hypothetical protein
MRHDIPEADFIAHFWDWTTYPVVVDGELVGAVVMRGPEIHACITPAGFTKWYTEEVRLATLDRILKEYGHAITAVTTEAGAKFVRRLGFKQQGDTPLWVLNSEH